MVSNNNKMLHVYNTFVHNLHKATISTKFCKYKCIGYLYKGLVTYMYSIQLHTTNMMIL